MKYYPTSLSNLNSQIGKLEIADQGATSIIINSIHNHFSQRMQPGVCYDKPELIIHQLKVYLTSLNLSDNLFISCTISSKHQWTVRCRFLS